MLTHQVQDRRGSELRTDTIERWYDLPSGFRIGLHCTGEFRMGANAGQVVITKKDGTEWMNFGNYRFYFPDWNAGGVQPEHWNNPLYFSADGMYLALNWLYAHRHSAISPILLHLPSRTYSLVEPRRILTVKSITMAKDMPILSCYEMVWLNSQLTEHTNVKVGVSTGLQAIDEFYKLDPFEIETDVYSWKEGVLSIEPLRNFRRVMPANEKEREEIKRDRNYSPIQRWQHVKALMDWVCKRK